MSASGYKETIFDKILDKRIPAKVVYEDEHVLAFHDVAPKAAVHVLVIPKKKAASFAEFKDRSSSEVGELFVRAAKVADILGLKTGYRIVVNVGKDGGQTVDYVHVHILGGGGMSHDDL